MHSFIIAASIEFVEYDQFLLQSWSPVILLSHFLHFLFLNLHDNIFLVYSPITTPHPVLAENPYLLEKLPSLIQDP